MEKLKLMHLKIHAGRHLIWITNSWDASMQTKALLPQCQLFEHPTSSDIDRVIHELDRTAPTLFLIRDDAPEHILHAMKRSFRCIEAAGGVVRDLLGRYLMIYRRGHWDLPKGKVDDGESLEECALREVQEETGLTSLRMKDPLLTTYHVYDHEGRAVLKSSHWFYMDFVGKEPAVPQTEEDIERIEWFSEKEVVEKMESAYPSIREVMEACGIRGPEVWG
jgi:8-oxo-dGTP pyrophosphatase MutT (NUDIX family)